MASQNPNAAPIANARKLHIELLEAVADERNAVARDPWGRPVSVGCGLRLSDTATRYEFEGVGKPWIREGRTIAFRTQTALISGIVVAADPDRVVLDMHADLGEQTDPGELLSDVAWLQEAVYRRIAAIDAELQRWSSGPPFHLDAALRAIGEAAPTTFAMPVPEEDSCAGLNTGQLEALRCALSCSPAFLWGPPGTGKTELLSRVIHALYRSNQRVLAVAFSNNAVDALLERVFQFMSAHDDVKDGEIIRFGSRYATCLTRRTEARIGFDAVVSRRLVESMLVNESSGATADLVRAQVARSCRVLGTTVHHAILSPIVRREFDVVVVDEASTVPLAALYAVAGLAPRSILAGDFRQLGPVTRATSSMARKWLARDAFEASGVVDDVEHDDPPPNLAMLTEQHRMAPDICGLVSDAYGDRLVTHASIIARSPGPLGCTGLFYLDTGADGATVERNARTNSRSNPVHARLVRGLVDELLRQRVIGPPDLTRIRIITPFVDQAREIEKHFANRGRYRPQVGTVHVTQARESDIVILDLTDAPNLPVNGFWRARSHRDDGGRLLTVAMSRARNHLIVVGDFEFHLHRSGTGSVLRKALVQFLECGRDIRDVCKFRLVA